MTRKQDKRTTTTKAPPKLTLLQQAFVQAYLGIANGNATRACRTAGYKGKQGSLEVQGHDNLNNPKITQAIQARQAVMQAVSGVTIENITATFMQARQMAIDNHDVAGLTAANRELAKHLGYYEQDNLQRGDRIGIVMR